MNPNVHLNYLIKMILHVHYQIFLLNWKIVNKKIFRSNIKIKKGIYRFYNNK